VVVIVFVQLRAKDAEHEEEIVQIKQKVGQDQRFSILKYIILSHLLCLHLVDSNLMKMNAY